MEYPYELKTVLQKLTKGFTLLEVVIVLFCTSLLMLLSLAIKIPVTSNEIYNFENTYKMMQLKSMAEISSYPLNHNYSSNVLNLTFNQHGNVNQAQTLKINNQYFVIQLGRGRYEKR